MEIVSGSTEALAAYAKLHPKEKEWNLEATQNFQDGYLAALALFVPLKHERLVVFKHKTCEGQRLYPFTIDAERAKTFHQEPGFGPTTIEPVYQKVKQ